jgi:hypothetical protein
MRLGGGVEPRVWVRLAFSQHRVSVIWSPDIDLRPELTAHFGSNIFSRQSSLSYEMRGL